jgi:hypothetical protein
MSLLKIVGSVLTLGLCFAPRAGATWTEVGDAGDLPRQLVLERGLLNKIARRWLEVLIALIGVVGTVNQVLATPLIDQQQPIIDTSVGGLAIGGTSAQKLAQVVTTGASGFLTAVRLPVVCDAGSNLVVEIQRVTGGVPNGIVLTSQTHPEATLPPGPIFKDLIFSTPVFFSVGEQFAIVLKSAESCAVFQGPVGDSYPGGNLYFDALPNPPGWVCVCSFSGDRFDLPFQTLVDPLCTPPVISGAAASPSTLWPPNDRMVDVTVGYAVTSSCPTSCTLNVASNEALDAIGDGNTTPDWIVSNPNLIWLRAERAGTGNGRIYSVTIVCTNSAGQSSTSTVKVTVPHDQRD